MRDELTCTPTRAAEKPAAECAFPVVPAASTSCRPPHFSAYREIVAKPAYALLGRTSSTGKARPTIFRRSDRKAVWQQFFACSEPDSRIIEATLASIAKWYFCSGKN
ncbi:hypothetical protein [Rhizobium sp. BK376]|uniref:hypothetical protein n=1 Tax=Rhizobium sp. BK376 TaxID=2512149 RepID=UPI00104FF83D|nr:hypothetical protein [Rhizobium sp. BK376]